MINAIGFKNFRRFENFPIMKLGKINVFVGRNNAGKSTVIKAVELFKGNLKTLSTFKKTIDGAVDSRPMFVFDVDEIAEIHIDSFERALYNKATRKEITLEAEYNGFHVEIVLNGAETIQNYSTVAVPYSSIHFYNDDMDVAFNYNTRQLDAKFSLKDATRGNNVDLAKAELIGTEHNYSKAKDELDNVESKLAIAMETDDFMEIARLNSKKKTLSARCSKLLGECKRLQKLIEEGETQADFLEIHMDHLPETEYIKSSNMFKQIFDDMLEFSNTHLSVFGITKKQDQKKKENEHIVVPHRLIGENRSIISQYSEQFSSLLTEFETVYIPAHAASQKVIFLKGDRGDFLSKTLHEFCKLQISDSDDEWKWVVDWMVNYGIGDGFEILPFSGAGYSIKIKDGSEIIDLADKGIGTIQIMTLLLHLAVIWRKKPTNPTILIEEPEQNIHPMLQSRLAVMLHDFQKQFSKDGNEMQMIVETHSEYLVRQTQVLVGKSFEGHNAEEIDKLNDESIFKVFYFEKENIEKPVNAMLFDIDGRFVESFGKGFFDEAGSLTAELPSGKDESDTLPEFNWDAL